MYTHTHDLPDDLYYIMCLLKALMLAFQFTRYRLFPLPPTYNFRRFTFTSLYNIKGPARPVVTRTSIFRQIATEVSEGSLDKVHQQALEEAYVNTALHAANQGVESFVEMMRYEV